jgi:hypothetical protein
LTAIGFGIAPAYVSSGSEPLTERGGTGTRQNRRLRGLLVAGEVALSVILVSGAGLFAKSLQRLQLVNPGFEAAPGLMFGTELPPARYRQAPQALQAFREIERRLRDLPQVKAVGLAKAAALQGAAYTADATVEGRRGDDYERELHCNATTPMYFRALATPLIRGRRLAEDDEREGAPLVTLVNETLEEILPGRQCDRGRFDCSSPDRIIRVTSLFRGPPTGWLTRIADGFIGATCRGVGRSGK